ncbi:flagellar biosynthesis protein FlgE [Burkholderia sp. Leaf177]|uniref:flagellar hook protein FlgE n=1 Tax=Burkholderia sp. Leaf177 TaxID=1736287 RepID=UPI0006F59196|nr:flagellar hook protein FlgE [Burkholderia sp. Leaf177]KQR82440.1 flagellar biosynthesis protein FlgE [Burkholderia sp. Leaf177]
MGYQQGLSGLSGASSDLDVIGNNIANANTVGFKQSQAQFADMYANSVATAVNNQVGIGTKLAEVQQQFGQGTITSTNQALDVAINGNGFFQMSDNGSSVYSRNGVFHLNADGTIGNSAGLLLMGYAANKSGIVNSAATVPLTVSTANLPPVATKNVKFGFNLNSQSADIPSTTAFSATDSTTYSATSSINVNDSLGGTHQVAVYFVKNSTGSWTAYGTTGTPPAPVGPNADGKLGTVSFDASGNMTGTSKFNLTIPDGAVSGGTQALTMDFTGTTQFGATSGVQSSSQDGAASASLTGFSVGTDGTLTGNYSNGNTQALGQIALANFANQNGLQDLGGNVYAQTGASGAAQISVPGATNHGTLQGGAVENSNVDLTSELVNLITAQRNYQANAQTIKTQQTVDQTLINL